MHHYRYPDKLILEALIITQGNVSQASFDLGCSKKVIYARLASNPEMRSALEAARVQPLIKYDFTRVHYDRLSTKQLKSIYNSTKFYLEYRGVELE